MQIPPTPINKKGNLGGRIDIKYFIEQFRRIQSHNRWCYKGTHVTSFQINRLNNNNEQELTCGIFQN